MTTVCAQSSLALSQPLDWLWPGRFVAGRLALIDGDPGVGKSLVTLDLAARLSSGTEMPDGFRPSQPSTVLLLSAEDNASDTVVPRLLAAGADLSHCRIWDRFTDEPFVLPRDWYRLQFAIQQTEARLVVFDPLLAFLGCEASALNEIAIRRALEPLDRVAEITRAVILLVRHLTKTGVSRQAIYRGLGSIAILAAVRSAFLAARHPADATLQVLACTKNNLAPMCPSLGYRISTSATGAPRIDWTGVVDCSADDLTTRRRRGLAVPTAVAFLQKHLADGPRQRDWLVQLAAHSAHLSLRTLERAKAHLRVLSQQRHENAGNAWYWSLPVQSPEHDNHNQDG